MITFEIAKALKEAGFPQDVPDRYGDEQSQWWCQHGEQNPECYWIQSDEMNDDDTYGEEHEGKILCKQPSIEDLLRELGEDFAELGFTGFQYKATTWTVPKLETKDETPELALAHLFLAIHGK